jgi:hypothetical protein
MKMMLGISCDTSQFRLLGCGKIKEAMLYHLVLKQIEVHNDDFQGLQTAIVLTYRGMKQEYKGSKVENDNPWF